MLTKSLFLPKKNPQKNTNIKRWQNRKTVARQLRILPSYRLWRLRIFVRDKYICVLCGKQFVYVEADHYPIPLSVLLKKYEINTLEKAILCKPLWDVSNGRTLCKVCHRNTPTYGKNALKYESLPSLQTKTKYKTS